MIRHRMLRERVLLSLGGRIIVFIVLYSTCLAQSPSWDVNNVSLIMEKIIDDWEKHRAINVDPRAKDHLANEAVHFISIFGYDYSVARSPKRIPKVIALIEDEAAIRQIVHNYLDDAMSEKNLTNVMERMAKLIGSSAKQAGWPVEGPNPFELIDMRTQWPEGKYVLLSEGKKHSPSSFRQFLVLPGDHRISNDVNAWAFSIKSISKDKPQPKTHGGR